MISTPKIFKRIEEDKKKDFEKRAKGFNEEYRVLANKWGCDLKPLLRSNDISIFATLGVVDIKDIVEKKKNEDTKKT